MRQGKHVPGGKHSYLVNGNMIGGFALVAWPATDPAPAKKTGVPVRARVVTIHGWPAATGLVTGPDRTETPWPVLAAPGTVELGMEWGSTQQGSAGHRGSKFMKWTRWSVRSAGER